MQGDAIHTHSGPKGAAAALSFIAVVFSFAVSWVNCAADYNVKMKVNTKQSSIFLATYAGIAIPAILVQTLGAALAAQTHPAWKKSYDVYGVGGPLALALEPAGGFGKFLMVIAALSSIPVSDVLLLMPAIPLTDVASLHRTTSQTITRSPSTHRTSVHGRYESLEYFSSRSVTS